MNKKIIVGVFVFGAALLLGSLLLAQGKAAEYTGILSDVRCWTAGTAGDGTNMRTNPEKHTIACLKMPACEKSGYGIIMKDAAGKYEFTKFDPAGSKMALDLLNKTTKTDNMTIKVKGIMEKNMIKVESIVETEQ